MNTLHFNPSYEIKMWMPAKRRVILDIGGRERRWRWVTTSPHWMWDGEWRWSEFCTRGYKLHEWMRWWMRWNSYSYVVGRSQQAPQTRAWTWEQAKLMLWTVVGLDLILIFNAHVSPRFISWQDTQANIYLGLSSPAPPVRVPMCPRARRLTLNWCVTKWCALYIEALHGCLCEWVNVMIRLEKLDIDTVHSPFTTFYSPSPSGEVADADAEDCLHCDEGCKQCELSE